MQGLPRRVREIVLRRALDPTDRVERLVQRHPSLAMETLHAGLSAGRLVTLQRWQGSRAALAALAGVGEPVGKARDARVLHVVERAGGRPSPLPIAEAHLGPYTAARATLDRAGATWLLATPHDARVPAFLAALRQAEDAFEKAQGAAIPRFVEHRALPRGEQ
ncbi:MAG: hypothetical protein QOE90_3655, partial [Thermoplasmata archaeon]|nr:hypothetical protein [Thermoplasmata archaeon]